MLAWLRKRNDQEKKCTRMGKIKRQDVATFTKRKRKGIWFKKEECFKEIKGKETKLFKEKGK